MTDIVSASSKASATQGHADSLPRLVLHFARVCVTWPVNLLIVWQERLRERQALAEMESYRLDDMGIGREAARREAAKSFWRA